jgi:hypothetical protein
MLLEEWCSVTMRFKVERESEMEDLLGPVARPCEGAWLGAYLDGDRRARFGWFVTLDEAPAELEGHPVRLLEATEEGVTGHLLIRGRS